MTETASPPATPTPEVAATRRLPRWAVLLLAAALVGSWATWAVHAYPAHVRTVTMTEFRADLESGTVRTYVGLTELRMERAWPPDDETRFSTAPIPEPDAPWTSSDLPIVAVAYYLDDPRSPIRVIRVAPFGEAGPGAVRVHALVQQLEAAGVQPRAESVPSTGWQANPSAERAQVWGGVTVVLALVALFAIRPTRGTRWFWFWLFYAPLGLGVLAYAVAECLRPRRPGPAGGDRSGKWRLRGIVGFVISGLAAIVIPY